MSFAHAEVPAEEPAKRGQHSKRPSLEPLLPTPVTNAGPHASRGQGSSSSRDRSTTTADRDDGFPLPSHSSRRLSTISEVFGFPAPEQLRVLPKPVLSFIKNNLGFLYVAVASACFTVVNIVVAFLSTEPDDTAVSTCFLMFSRMSITAAFCYIVLRAKGDPNPALGPPDVRKLLALRGVVGFGGIASQYYALNYLSVSDVTTINFLTPLATGIGAALILGEPYRLIEAIAAVISLCSVALIAKPSFLFGDAGSPSPPTQDQTPVTESERLTAIGGLFIGVIGGTGAYLTIRFIGKRANALHSMIYFSYYSCIVSAILMIFIPSQRPSIPSHPQFLALLLMIGVMGFFAQMCLTLGLQKENAGRAASATYLQLPLALILDKVIFGQIPDVLSLLGSFVIVSCALAVMWYKQEGPEDGDDEDEFKEPSTPMARYTSVPRTEEEEEEEIEGEDPRRHDRATSLFSPALETPAPPGPHQ